MIDFQGTRAIRKLMWSSMLFGGLLSPQGSFGTTYHVAPWGNDADPGSEEQPFQTINYGASVLEPGDTAYIREGTYPESFIHAIPGGTSWDTPVTVAAYPGERVTIQGSLLFVGSATAYIIIDGLILDGENLDRDQWWPLVQIDYSPTPADAAHHIRIQNSEIKNGPSPGVYINCGSHDNEIINTLVHNNGEHGLYIASANNLVEDSDVYQNAGWGIHIYDENICDGQVNNNIVRSNEVHDNGAPSRGAGIILSSGSGNIADSNSVWGNQGGGIHVDYGSIAAQVTNNTVYENQDFGLLLGFGSADAAVGDNSVHDNYGPNIVDDGVNTLSALVAD